MEAMTEVAPIKTTQEIYDQVASHLLTQAERSILPHPVDEDPVCAYRGENNLKCAVGCVILDEAYNSEIEGDCVYNSQVRAALHNSGLINSKDHYDQTLENLSLLAALQDMHDSDRVKDVTKQELLHFWSSRLIQIASNFKLSDEAARSHPNFVGSEA